MTFKTQTMLAYYSNVKRTIMGFTHSILLYNSGNGDLHFMSAVLKRKN